MPIPCLACRQNMSEHALLCPHCGARREDRWDPPAPSEGSPDDGASSAARIERRDADALDLAVTSGPLAFVAPRPEAVGRELWLEWALTLLAAPVLAPGLVLGLTRLRASRWLMRAHELPLTLSLGVLGGAGLVAVGALAGWSQSAIGGVVGVSVGALLFRLGLRHRARRAAIDGP
ncbi:MAG: hypothetical protein KF729_10090 [Sandaracinaceae bacterium]|nr:hypothetical protein [Sandaracinaceae bacterium]